jgi:hypothetical protein
MLTYADECRQQRPQSSAPSSHSTSASASTTTGLALGAVAVSLKKKIKKLGAVRVFDIRGKKKRFYYCSLHLALEQLKQDGRRGAAGARVGEGPAGEGPADKNVSAARIPETEDDDAARAAEQHARAEEAEQACTCNTCNSASPGASGGGCPASVAGKHATISEEAASEEQRVAAVLDAACEYLHVAALLYDSSDAAERRPSQDADAEATWFLSKSIWADGFVLLEYVAEAGRDLRPRRSAQDVCRRTPAAALLLLYCCFTAAAYGATSGRAGEQGRMAPHTTRCATRVFGLKLLVHEAFSY